jgi:excisionase family DNA binding protein
MTEKLLLKIEEAVEMLNLGKRKIEELSASRQIPHVKIGKCLRFSPDHLRAWIDSQKIECLAS